MEIVVDTSAVLAVLLNEPSRPAVLAVTIGQTFVAPPTLQWEVGNALGAMFKRRRLTLPDAVRVGQDFTLMPIGIRPISLEDAVRLASRLNIYAYDAYMIACALGHGLPLLSLERGLKDAGRRAGVTLLEEVKP